MAPPLPPVMSLPVALPSARVRFCTVSRGVGWSWQCEVVHTWAWSQVFWYRMRIRPPPLSVTLPPPSRTTCWLVFTTFAVAVIVMVTGAGPQENVMMPPFATAATTACDVQPAGVPVPITVVGCAVSAAWAAAGTGASPDGFPAGGPAGTGGAGGRADGFGAADAGRVVVAALASA